MYRLVGIFVCACVCVGGEVRVSGVCGGGALSGRVVVHVVVDVLLMLCGFGRGADWYDTLVLCILSLHLYRTVHLWYIFVHTSIVPFMWGGVSMLFVWSTVVHFQAMVFRDSLESTSCLVFQGLTVPGGGSGSRSPPVKTLFESSRA